MTMVPLIEYDEASAEVRAVYDDIMKTRGTDWINNFWKAIAHDPDYALAYAGIADYHNWLGVYGVLPSKECFQSAVENSQKAIELDPELGEAYASLAFAQHGGNFAWEESERNFQTALRLNPNVAETHVWYSIKLTTEGRFTEGIKHAERAVELETGDVCFHHCLTVHRSDPNQSERARRPSSP